MERCRSFETIQYFFGPGVKCYVNKENAEKRLVSLTLVTTTKGDPEASNAVSMAGMADPSTAPAPAVPDTTTSNDDTVASAE